MTQHILGVARTLPFHSIGGMQAIAWDLFREFARLGHHVTVITTTIPDRSGPFVADGVHVIPLEGTKAERCDGAWWRASAQWFESGAAGPVDSVLSISSAGAAIAARHSLAPNAKFIFQAHGTSWGEFVSKWRTGRPIQWAKSVKNLYWLFKDTVVYKSFDCIALVGDVLQTQFTQRPVRWMTGNVSTALIRNGVNERVFHPNAAARQQERAVLGWAVTDRVVVFAARLHPQKGGEVALRAFHQLANDMAGAKLLVIGGGEDLERLQTLSKDLGCSHQVHFTGPVARERMASLLAAGDAFVFPTLRQEGLPMNVLEALATGLRPVCSSAMQTVFGAALPIAYANPQDVSDFSAVLRVTMHAGSSPVSLLTPDYSLDACAQQYLAVLQPQGSV